MKTDLKDRLNLIIIIIFFWIDEGWARVERKGQKNKTCLTLTQGTAAWYDMLCLFSVLRIWFETFKPWWGCTGALPFSL